jgi:GT2 family glycosyltransferase
MLSIVIPTYHRNDLLKDCLKSLSPTSQSLDKKYYEVIVTDDGKVSNAKEMISNDFPWCRWVQGPQSGPASNRNFGASNANNDWIVFIDDDCMPDVDLLLIYKNAMEENPNIKVFEGSIKADREQMRFDEESPINLTGGCLWSCNFMIYKKTFNQMGGFDVNYPSAAMEDVDLRERLTQEGLDILFIKSAVVIHPWRKLRNISFVKKHYQSYQYFAHKFNCERSIIEVFKQYSRGWFYILKNAIKYKFRGISHKILIINYHLILNLKFVLFNK